MNGTTGGWTAEKEKTLRELWPEKQLSCADIGERVGMSRNAVIGKARRLGLGSKDWNKPEPKPKQPRTRVHPGNIARKRNSRIFDPEPFTPRSVLLPSLELAIEDWSDDRCKYIAGDDRLACGHPVAEGKSWCPVHCALVYAAPKDRTEKQKAHDARFAEMQRRKAGLRGEKTEWMAEEAV